MPSRILREGILTSQRIDRLSESAELFYRRLMSRLDDQGRCEAHAELLRTACYPLRVDRVKARHVERWIKECAAAGLLVVYEVTGKRYLQAIDWRQQVRAPSKCPAPDAQMLCKCPADDKQALSDVHLGVGVVVVEGVIEDVGVCSGERADAAHLSAGGPVNGEAVAFIPLNDGSEFQVTAEHVAEFEKLYPKVDIPQTLNEIRGWNLAHPTRRKTRRGVLSHVTAWMAKEQNRG